MAYSTYKTMYKKKRYDIQQQKTTTELKAPDSG